MFFFFTLTNITYFRGFSRGSKQGTLFKYVKKIFKIFVLETMRLKPKYLLVLIEIYDIFAFVRFEKATTYNGTFKNI